ncbi:hypothetical protein VTH82DRAFT_3386 [Thermothelomyces myriococcoides]
MDFITTVLGHDQDRHIDWLTIHPRTRSTPSSIPIDLEALEVLTSTFGDRVPILLSGDVFALNALPFTSPLLASTPTFTQSIPKPRSTTATTSATDQAAEPSTEDSRDRSDRLPSSPATYHIPKLAGLMSARALLANPALYAGYEACPWEAVETFLSNVARAPLPHKLVLHHLSEMCGPGMGPNKTSLLTKQERAAMLACGNMLDLIDYLDTVRGVKRRGE